MTKEGCRFCLENNLLVDAPLFENDWFYVLGMTDPTRQHAVMIIPKAHAETPFEITGEQWAHMEAPMAFAKSKLAVFKPDGYTIGWNVGAIAGQTVGHVHLHVMCRFDYEPASGLGLDGLIKRVNARSET